MKYQRLLHSIGCILNRNNLTYIFYKFCCLFVVHVIILYDQIKRGKIEQGRERKYLYASKLALGIYSNVFEYYYNNNYTFSTRIKKYLPGIVFIQILPFCIKHRVVWCTYFRHKQNVYIYVCVCLIKG